MTCYIVLAWRDKTCLNCIFEERQHPEPSVGPLDQAREGKTRPARKALDAIRKRHIRHGAMEHLHGEVADEEDDPT